MDDGTKSQLSHHLQVVKLDIGNDVMCSALNILFK